MSAENLDVLELLSTAPEPAMEVPTESVLALARERARRRTATRYAVVGTLIAAVLAIAVAALAVLPRRATQPAEPTGPVSVTLGTGETANLNDGHAVMEKVRITYDPTGPTPIVAAVSDGTAAETLRRDGGWIMLADHHLVVAYAHDAISLSLATTAKHGTTYDSRRVPGTDLLVAAYWFVSPEEAATVTGMRWFDGRAVHSPDAVLPTLPAPDRRGVVYFFDPSTGDLGQFDSGGSIWASPGTSGPALMATGSQGTNGTALRTIVKLPAGAHEIAAAPVAGVTYDPVIVVDWPAAEGVLAVLTGTSRRTDTALISTVTWVDADGRHTTRR